MDFFLFQKCLILTTALSATNSIDWFVAAIFFQIHLSLGLNLLSDLSLLSEKMLTSESQACKSGANLFYSEIPGFPTDNDVIIYFVSNPLLFSFWC